MKKLALLLTTVSVFAITSCDNNPVDQAADAAVETTTEAVEATAEVAEAAVDTTAAAVTETATAAVETVAGH